MKLLQNVLCLLTVSLLWTQVARADDKPKLFRAGLNGKWGYIDAAGKVVIPLQFDDAWGFREGLARVEVGVKYGFINESGQIVIKPKWKWAFSFEDGLASVDDEQGHQFFIDHTGKMMLKAPNGYVCEGFDHGLALARPFAPPYLSKSRAQAPKLGWIDKSGRFAISPRFEAAKPFSEGMALVCLHFGLFSRSNLWGFINRSGKFVIAPRFNEADAFHEGKAAVSLGERHFFINTRGQHLFKSDYENVIGGFSGGLAPVKINGAWGAINSVGKVVVAPQFELVGTFTEGRAPFFQDGKWGMINSTGQVIVKPTYESLFFFHNGLADVTPYQSFKARSENIYINRDGKVIWPPQPKKPVLPTTKQN